MDSNEGKVKVSQAVYDGLEAIRSSGATNMFMHHTVLELAEEWGYDDTALWLMDNKEIYAGGIFRGFEPIEDEPEPTTPEVPTPTKQETEMDSKGKTEVVGYYENIIYSEVAEREKGCSLSHLMRCYVKLSAYQIVMVLVEQGHLTKSEKWGETWIDVANQPAAEAAASEAGSAHHSVVIEDTAVCIDGGNPSDGKCAMCDITNVCQAYHVFSTASEPASEPETEVHLQPHNVGPMVFDAKGNYLGLTTDIVLNDGDIPFAHPPDDEGEPRVDQDSIIEDAFHDAFVAGEYHEMRAMYDDAVLAGDLAVKYQQTIETLKAEAEITRTSEDTIKAGRARITELEATQKSHRRQGIHLAELNEEQRIEIEELRQRVAELEASDKEWCEKSAAYRDDALRFLTENESLGDDVARFNALLGQIYSQSDDGDILAIIENSELLKVKS